MDYYQWREEVPGRPYARALLWKDQLAAKLPERLMAKVHAVWRSDLDHQLHVAFGERIVNPRELTVPDLSDASIAYICLMLP